LRCSIQEESQNQAIRKDVRYVSVQVVLLLTIDKSYQRLLVKISYRMVLTIVHRVVQYSLTQKVGELVGKPLPEPIYKPTLLSKVGFWLIQFKNKSLSVCQLRTKGVYIVGSCSLPRYLRKRSVILWKNF
jgi:hypothetical protein